MPKKTRQEKIIADLRRKLEVTKANTVSWVPPEETELEAKPLRQKVEISIPPSSITPEPLFASTVLIKKDLFKTFILSLLAVSFELVLYFKSQGS